VCNRALLRPGRRKLVALGLGAWLGLGAVAVHANGDAVSERDPGNPGAARLGRSDRASEYWDLAATFESGHAVFARFQVTNEGPGERTAYALGHILFPDGQVVRFQNGRLEGKWRLSEDRLRLEIGSSVLDLHGPTHHFEVDKNKRGIKLFLDYEAPGSVRSWSAAPEGYSLDLLTLAGTIRGSVWVRDVTPEPVELVGAVTVTHAWINSSEFDLARLRIEGYGGAAKAGDSDLYWVALEGKEGETSTWLVVRSGESWIERGGFAVSRIGKDEASKKGYPIPQRLLLEGDELQGRVELGPARLEFDPLSIAPAPFRWFLSLRSKPKQVWLASRYAIEWQGEGEERVFEGRGFSSFYYLNRRK